MKKVQICSFSKHFFLSFLPTDPSTYTAISTRRRTALQSVGLVHGGTTCGIIGLSAFSWLYLSWGHVGKCIFFHHGSKKKACKWFCVCLHSVANILVMSMANIVQIWCRGQFAFMFCSSALTNIQFPLLVISLRVPHRIIKLHEILETALKLTKISSIPRNPRKRISHNWMYTNTYSLALAPTVSLCC